MLHARNITYSFESENNIFKELDLEVKAGEIISVVGPSGAGKTTLLKCLAGKLQLLRGDIFIDGIRLQGPEEQLLAGHDDIALVDQYFSIDHHFSVKENMFNRVLHLAHRDRIEFVDELLAVFGLEEIQDQPSKYISGGEKQRLSMACALAQEPKYLLLDEPFSNLDVHLKKSIGSYLKKLQELRNMGVILVTHDGVDALSWSNKIYFLNQKGGLRSYLPEKAYYAPKTLFEGRFFGQLNSVYIQGKQLLFRPIEYSLEKGIFHNEVEINYLSTDFHGHFYANYFKLANGKEIVLYSDRTLHNINKVYV